MISIGGGLNQQTDPYQNVSQTVLLGCGFIDPYEIKYRVNHWEKHAEQSKLNEIMT